MGSWHSVGFLIGFVVALIILAVIRGFVIRAAIGVYTWHSGITSRVPMPSIGRAIGIAFAASIAGAIAGFEVGLNVGFFLTTFGATAQTAKLTVQLVTLPISVVTTGLVLSFMLPTTYSKGVHVAICELLLSIIIAAVALAVLYVSSLAFAR